MSSISKDKKYVFGFSDIYEDPGSQEPHIWVLLGMLAFLWLVGCILMCVCLCCNDDDKLFRSKEWDDALLAEEKRRLMENDKDESIDEEASNDKKEE